MNKKIIAGLMSAAAVGSFWACGSGDVAAYDEIDYRVNLQYVQNEGTDNVVSVVRDACKADPICEAEHPGFASGKAAPQSSSSIVTVASSASVTPNPTSSDATPIVIASATSSAADIPIVNPTSSSAGVVITPTTGLGTCAPVKESINKGESTTFKFTPNKKAVSGYEAMDFVKANFDWKYGDGKGDGTASATTSDKVTYTNPGKKIVSATVTMADGNSETVTCSPLQVQGTPIDGCTCTASSKTADVADPLASTVTWTVSNCVSTGAEITGYTWPTGFVSEGNTGSFTFTTKDQSVTPEVTVTNNDSTAVVVNKCPAAIAVDGAETVTPGDKTVYKGERTITFASCNNKTGSQQIQVASNVADCAKLITSEASMATFTAYWNNAAGDCKFGASASFPLTVELPEGATFEFTGGCY